MQANQPSDPVIDEVRDVRQRISARCGHDPDRLVAYYLQFQQQFRDRLLERAASTSSSAEPDAPGDRAGLTGFDGLAQRT
jgi:hypothetical protein